MAPSIVPWIVILFLHNVMKGVVTLASGNAAYDIEFTMEQMSMNDVLAGVANSTLAEIVAEGDRLWDEELQDQLKTSTVPTFNTTILDILQNETYPSESTLTDSTTKAMYSMWLNSTTSDVTTWHNLTETSQLLENSNSSQDSYKTETFTSSPQDPNSHRPEDTSSPQDPNSHRPEDTSSPRSEDSTPSVLQDVTLHNDQSTTALDSHNTSIISSTTDSDKLESTGNNLVETSTHTIVKTTDRSTVTDLGQKDGLQDHSTRRGDTENATQGLPQHTMFMIALVISIIVTIVLFTFSAYVCCKIKKRNIRQVYATRTSKEKYGMHNVAFDIKIESSNNNSAKTEEISV
ncbi:mucin-2-like [Lineus longissimus]|uniref:mucin-2-like n=1 Tax=Lineus longissimus TaxID=88925 RepID=UPI00315D2360